MGWMIEFRVKKPASRNYRLDGCWQLVAFARRLAMAYFAVFSPEQPFGNLGSLLYPVFGRRRSLGENQVIAGGTQKIPGGLDLVPVSG